MNTYHPKYSDQRDAIDWSRKVLRRKRKHVILDSETTGLGKTDEIIQLAIIDLDGNTLFNKNIRPTKKKRISSDSTEIHGLTMDKLSDCPTFSELKVPVKAFLRRKTIITYNASFDKRLYRQSWQLADGYIPKGDWDCAMLE